jgi:hypothetical protein
MNTEAEVMKSKIKFVSRMMMMQKTLREENENVIKLKGLCSDNRIPRGLLLEGAHAIKDGKHFIFDFYKKLLFYSIMPNKLIK